MRVCVAAMALALIVSGCTQSQETDRAPDEDTTELANDEANNPLERFVSVDPDKVETEDLDEESEDGRRVYRRWASWDALQAGVTHEAGTECDPGDVALSASWSSPGTSQLTVNGPYRTGIERMFFQTYRPTNGGNYEFYVRLRCERR